MSAKPTGHLVHREDGLYLILNRLFNAPIEQVWASMTRPAELETWIGTYTGSPDTGAVKFKMTAEPDAKWEYVSIRQCDAPHRFHGDFGEGEDSWRALFHLVEGDGMTNLTFGQRLRSPSDAATVGPGWDYYLDRLVASRADLPVPQWEHYYPAHAQFYKDMIVPARTV